MTWVPMQRTSVSVWPLLLMLIAVSQFNYVVLLCLHTGKKHLRRTCGRRCQVMFLKTSTFQQLRLIIQGITWILHCIALPLYFHIWAVMLVWSKGNINVTVSVLQYTIVYSCMSSSCRSVNWSGLRSSLV